MAWKDRIIMEAIILAGGLGTRLRPVVGEKPKSLALINGEPFLYLLLKRLASAGFQHLILATGYMGSQIRQAVGNTFAGMALEYSHETRPLGTGGALAKAMRHCRGNFVFALNGDTWLDMDYSAAAELWRKRGGIVITGVLVEDVERYGSLEIDADFVRSISEKNSRGPGWINGGSYVLPTDLFVNLQDDSYFSFEKDFLPGFLRRYSASLFHATGSFWDIGIPEDYMAFQHFSRTRCL